MTEPPAPAPSRLRPWLLAVGLLVLVALAFLGGAITSAKLTIVPPPASTSRVTNRPRPDVVVADTDEEAMELWANSGAFCGAAWFAPFGFSKLLAPPDQAGSLTPQDLMDRGMLLVGSPDTVSRQMETLTKDTPVKWLFAWTYNGLMPHDKILRSLELFQTKVLPRFD